MVNLLATEGYFSVKRLPEKYYDYASLVCKVYVAYSGDEGG